MPARGQSGREYLDTDIADEAKYRLMKDDTLWTIGAEEEQVFPVRHPTKPYFRRFRVTPFRQLIDGRKERSETHKKCIDFLLRNIRDRGLKLSTPTFENDARTADGQVLLNVAKGHYQWWSDTNGTRIPIGFGRYIQPDLCGRLANGDAFAPSLKWPSLIIEVIDTHFPEENTLFELLKLSTQNHIVALHFIRARAYSSYWSQLETPEGKRPTLRVVHLLVDGNLVVNGVPYEEKRAPPSDRAAFARWYAGFKSVELARITAAKKD